MIRNFFATIFLVATVLFGFGTLPSDASTTAAGMLAAGLTCAMIFGVFLGYAAAGDD